jgi:hypothetical protein
MKRCVGMYQKGLLCKNISSFIDREKSFKRRQHLPSYFFEEKERRGGQTSDSAVCEVPIDPS